MGEFVKLSTEGLKEIRKMNPAMTSYNVEMTEVTGGTFWKAYTPEQIAGTEEVPPPDFSQGNPIMSMLEWIDPIDSKNPKLMQMADDAFKKAQAAQGGSAPAKSKGQ